MLLEMASSGQEEKNPLVGRIERMKEIRTYSTQWTTSSWNLLAHAVAEAATPESIC